MNQAKVRGRQDGYIVATISRGAAKSLLAVAVHPDIYCRHMMVAYRPKAAAWEQFGKLIGQNVVLRVIGMVQDDRAQAVLVEGCPSENKHPHITVSCAHGVSPAYANQMVARAVAEGRIQPLDLGRKVVSHIKFKLFTDYASGSAQRKEWSTPEGSEFEG